MIDNSRCSDELIIYWNRDWSSSSWMSVDHPALAHSTLCRFRKDWSTWGIKFIRSKRFLWIKMPCNLFILTMLAFGCWSGSGLWRSFRVGESKTVQHNSSHNYTLRFHFYRRMIPTLLMLNACRRHRLGWIRSFHSWTLRTPSSKVR